MNGGRDGRGGVGEYIFMWSDRIRVDAGPQSLHYCPEGYERKPWNPGFHQYSNISLLGSFHLSLSKSWLAIRLPLMFSGPVSWGIMFWARIHKLCGSQGRTTKCMHVNLVWIEEPIWILSRVDLAIYATSPHGWERLLMRERRWSKKRSGCSVSCMHAWWSSSHAFFWRCHDIIAWGRN